MTLLNTLPSGDGIANFLPRKVLIKTVKLLVLALALGVISGCTKQPEVARLQVEIWQNGQPISCERFENNQQQWLIRQLAFFVSDLTFSSPSSSIQPELIDSPWQTADLTLIKPALADCDTPELVNNQKSQQTKSNNWMTFSAPIDVEASDTLSFTLGVPFALNHENPLLQASPLNVPSMFWSWRSGHKFFRLDLQAENRSWVFHLGSVGCESASTMRGPQKECVQPNRLTFRLAKLHFGTKLILHLDRLLKGTTIEGSQSCLFHDGQDSCQVLLENLQQQDVFEWH
jgi:uncharacterized repeat protein (TIGR04052 family)